MNDVVFSETVTFSIGSFPFTSLRYFPSIRTSISLGLDTLKVTVDFAGKTMEWKTVRGQMGVTTKASTCRSRTGPPAERE